MAADVTAEEMIEALRTSFEARIRTALTWLPAHEALQLADAMCETQMEALAGLRVKYRSRPEVDGEAIAEDWRRSLTLSEITTKHGCSRSTAYNYHPNRDARGRKKKSTTGREMD